MAPLHAERLYEMIGVEHTLSEVERTIRAFVKGEEPPVVGAMLVTCSDESEHECADVFRRDFERSMLPARHFDDRSAFRNATLGGRYEWGAARIAEGHFALADGADEWKLMLLKVNAHVAVEDTPDGLRFGRLARYQGEGWYCGALIALLTGDTRPFALDLASVFRADDLDRVSILNDPSQVEPRARSLFAAIASARLQARRAMLDVQDHAPGSPTLTVILPCVTLNRRGHDSELLVGVYVCDRRTDGAHDEYCGLGDDPRAYRLLESESELHVTDEHVDRPRRARDHRALVREALGEREPADPRARAQVRAALHPVGDHPLVGNPAVSRAALTTALGAALAVAPVPAALALFAEGAVGIHHALTAHRIARSAEGDAAARAMLEEVRARVDHLDPEEARNLVELLRRTYG